MLSAATQCVTELFRFIEKVPPFSTTILWKLSRGMSDGVFTKSEKIKDVLQNNASEILRHSPALCFNHITRDLFSQVVKER